MGQRLEASFLASDGTMVQRTRPERGRLLKDEPITRSQPGRRTFSTGIAAERPKVSRRITWIRTAEGGLYLSALNRPISRGGDRTITLN
jgi:hypothetical protein